MTQSVDTRQDGRPEEAPARPPVRAGLAETLRFVATHTLPVFVRGVANPRFGVVALYSRLNQPGWSNATLRAMKARHGGAPVLVRALSGEMLVLFDPADIRRFFEEPVDTLAMDADDKYAGLAVFEPTGVICSHGKVREDRRRVNDEALAAGRPVHPSCGEFRTVVEEECRALTGAGAVDFPSLWRAMTRISRRVVLGDRAADDEELTDWLITLRGQGNWMGRSRPEANKALYAKASARIARYAADAPAHTLAARALAVPSPEGTDPLGQTHHWLLGIDLSAPVIARTLLLLALHTAEQDAVHAELADAAPELPRLRACVTESVRLYPIVPDLVRVTRTDTVWAGVRYPPGTDVLVPIGFHQRDPDVVPGGHLFNPGRWLVPGATADTSTAPFSHGGARCPGEDIALLLTSLVCAELLRDHRLTDAHPSLDTGRPLPGIVDTAGIRLRLTRLRPEAPEGPEAPKSE
ncbi:cytochrome P450 [Streptomyces sp. NBC_00249]|uniref:cytochrome P450 n=1 Tax=Streptomyces sp. NBC_00249 TaxID=2975690 RepID=UPI002259CC79|nr:cytochrome P450 [Streptomyces sp. NBC_00249]MCX5193035.1 cytochrome P450 [Streptomyces sp. NBC_00249]